MMCIYIYIHISMGLSENGVYPQRWFYGRDNDHEPMGFWGCEVLEDAKVERKAVDEAMRRIPMTSPGGARWCGWFLGDWPKKWPYFQLVNSCNLSKFIGIEQFALDSMGMDGHKS